ncbi:NUDIX domain-containing protein [Sphingobacterium sp. lm-10]|uniref:NUDIX hydrolase n=1 Tax=Sphingobacterium sp. lm-10 TaxID=2944904 RepID=UPI00202081AA|nr:NUDIX domain-containing protein [Sphingobacterium sp. lm-10]MCL7986444.1 NUDIX domain-containing protein [Sphingobacterium sp. lm-10]
MTKVIDKVALLCLRDKQVLTTRSKNKTTLYFPGGKREGNESDLACLTREIKEELDVQIIESTVKFFGVFEAQADGHEEKVIVSMRCYFADFEGTLLPSNEIESFEWITFQDKLKTSAVDHLIMDKLKEMDLIQ